jgi:hypothetical protein
LEQKIFVLVQVFTQFTWGYDPDPDPVDLKSQIRTKVVRIRNTGLVIVFLSDSRTNDSVFVLNKISNGVFSS